MVCFEFVIVEMYYCSNIKGKGGLFVNECGMVVFISARRIVFVGYWC